MASGTMLQIQPLAAQAMGLANAGDTSVLHEILRRTLGYSSQPGIASGINMMQSTINPVMAADRRDALKFQQAMALERAKNAGPAPKQVRSAGLITSNPNMERGFEESRRLGERKRLADQDFAIMKRQALFEQSLAEQERQKKLSLIGTLLQGRRYSPYETTTTTGTEIVNNAGSYEPRQVSSTTKRERNYLEDLARLMQFA